MWERRACLLACLVLFVEPQLALRNHAEYLQSCVEIAQALAEAADILIAVAVPEVDDILRPTPSRFAHMAIVDTLATGVAARLGERARESLRRVRYTLARLGVAIPAPTNDPTPLMKDLEPRE